MSVVALYNQADLIMALLHFSIILCSLLRYSALGVGAVDNARLFPDQPLFPGETLVSQNQVFEMGFFSRGKHSNRFIGVWYKNTPDVVVWVANRNNPIVASEAPVLMISGNGNLVISNGEIIIWSVNSSSNPVLQLLDSGNLVLVDNAKKGYLWQSFDHPTDTFLPGMTLVDDVDGGVERYLTSWRNPDDPSPGDFVIKIHNHGLADLVVLRGATKIYRQGQWNGVYFGGGTHFPSSIFNPEMVFKQERLIAIRDPYQSSLITRITLDSSGTIVRQHMNARKDRWNVAFTFPRDVCDGYASCGPNSLCKPDRPIQCHCLKGFAPKFQKDWDILDWSSGCERITPLSCEGGDGFTEVRGVKYPDMLSFHLNTSMSFGECRDECLKNCNCTAYANPFITDGGNGCLMWSGDLIDARELSGADAKQNIYVRASLSEIDPNTSSGEEEKENKRTLKLILISIASGALVSAIINGGLHFMARRTSRVGRNNEDLELHVIKMAEIVQATNNFCRENIIGVGGFGPVFKGKMPSGEEIAVKRLSRSSQQGFEEFRNEVMLIGKLQHRNLVRLLGCCVEEDERVLVYEYLHNKSLDYLVFDQNQPTLLTWPKRYDIIIGIARGLLYLHHDSRLKIIHRDLKTSNILLDADLNPKISDFGLARIFEENQSLARTKRVAGTYGYMAPEYAMDGKFSVKSDIFSLGVVLLEIITGKKNRGYGDSNCYLNLLGNAWMQWKKNKILEMMDECLIDTFVESEVKRCMQVGLLCVQKFAEDRPSMASVVSMLGGDGAFLPEPKEPGFFMERSCSTVRSSTSPCFMSDNETITITDLEAR